MDRRCTGDGCFGRKFLPGIDGPDSMYAQLEIYINNSIETCLDNFSTFEKQGYDIQANGTLDINVTTTEETVVAILNYPIDVIDPATKKQTRLTSFYYDTNIRLKKLHQLAVMLVNEDKNNESYDIRDYGFSDPYIEIGVIRHNLPIIDISVPQDNIVRITDTFSSVPFVFQFGRENRPPTLEYIPPKSVSEDDPFNESYFDFVIGYDPDESDITKYYSSGELDLYYHTNFSVDVSFLCSVPANPREFTVKVCVSDDHYKPYSCIPGGDMSRDWQDVKFNIDDC